MIATMSSIRCRKAIACILAVEPLPGQYDQRSDSCAQCIQLMTQGERPKVAAAISMCWAAS